MSENDNNLVRTDQVIDLLRKRGITMRLDGPKVTLIFPNDFSISFEAEGNENEGTRLLVKTTFVQNLDFETW